MKELLRQLKEIEEVKKILKQKRHKLFIKSTTQFVSIYLFFGFIIMKLLYETHSGKFLLNSRELSFVLGIGVTILCVVWFEINRHKRVNLKIEISNYTKVLNQALTEYQVTKNQIEDKLSEIEIDIIEGKFQRILMGRF